MCALDKVVQRNAVVINYDGLLDFESARRNHHLHGLSGATPRNRTILWSLVNSIETWRLQKRIKKIFSVAFNAFHKIKNRSDQVISWVWAERSANIPLETFDFIFSFIQNAKCTSSHPFSTFDRPTDHQVQRKYGVGVGKTFLFTIWRAHILKFYQLTEACLVWVSLQNEKFVLRSKVAQIEITSFTAAAVMNSVAVDGVSFVFRWIWMWYKLSYDFIVVRVFSGAVKFHITADAV